MANSIRARERRLAELKKEVTRRGFDRHASQLSNICELPADLQLPSLAALGGREAIQHIIVFPPQIQRGWHYVPKQALLFSATGVVHLLASIWPEQEPQATFLDGSGLLYLKATLLLLYGYLEIVVQGQAAPVRLGTEFNTVSWGFISAPLRQFLSVSKTTFGVPLDQIAYTPNARQAFEKLPFKFFNGVQLYGLLPGEELEELVFQEATRKRWFYIFQRPKTADTLLMLTTNYLVMIQEDLNVRQGWIITYIPRSNICEIASQVDGLWNELSIQLKRRDQTANYRLLLSKQAAETWRIQWLVHGGRWQEIPNG
ncbi:MAG: hypothetical protein ACM3XO_03950 [Bacteroidota bacterium]